MKLYDMVRKYGWEILAVLPSIPNVRAEGNVFFVDSGQTTTGLDSADGEHGHSWDKPFLTLNFAISQCTANQGDVILLAPGHTETIADTGTASGSTTDELVVDKAGISIIGLGEDALRPTFTFNGATDACCVILAGASNVSIKNLIFVGDLEDLANLMTVSATSDGLRIENCEFRDGGASKETIHQINLAAAADRVTIKNCRFFTTSGGTSTLANIEVAAVAKLTIIDCWFTGDVNTDGMVDNSGAAGTDFYIVGNVFNNLDSATGKVLVLHGSTTGYVAGNVAHAGLDATNPYTIAGVVPYDNWYTNAEGARAALQGASNDS